MRPFDLEKRHVQWSLASVGLAYLNHGLTLFYQARDRDYIEFQAATGNLCIAVELMLKALIARKAFHLLFKGLPKDLELALCYPDAISGPFAARNAYGLDLEHAAHTTIELDEVISLAYSTAPKVRDELRGHLKTVSRVRNASVHYLVPKMQRYQLDRIAYVALRINDLTTDAKEIPSGRRSQTDADKKFLESYDQELTERVAKKIEEAKVKARNIEWFGVVEAEGWEELGARCPVCSNGCVLEGNTVVETDETDGTPILGFVADSFECTFCLLKLEDPAELKLAGLEDYYDRASDYDRWVREKFGDPD